MQKWTLAQIKTALKELSEKGWVKSNRTHNTGIGKTLEDCLTRFWCDGTEVSTGRNCVYDDAFYEKARGDYQRGDIEKIRISRPRVSESYDSVSNHYQWKEKCAWLSLQG